jgi:hypothetical protein
MQKRSIMFSGPKGKQLAEQVFDLLDANNMKLEEFEAAFAEIKSILQDEDTNKVAA